MLHVYFIYGVFSIVGGSNFRVLKITIKDGEIQQEDKKMVIDDATKKSNGDTLFGFIAKCLAEFVKEKNITTKLPLGFTFSFPVHQTSLIAGTLITWTKDFDAPDVVDQDVVQLLHSSLMKRGVRNTGAHNIISYYLLHCTCVCHFIHSFIHSFTHSLTHSLTHSHTLPSTCHVSRLCLCM